MKSNKKKRTIVICSSAAFFREAVAMKKTLAPLGFKVKVPLTANIMERENDFEVSHYKTWFKDSSTYKRKTFLMRSHFNEVKKGDSILVLNYKKNGREGYIGGAVLMEIGVAFDAKKKIYILNPIDEECPYKEEILATQPIILNGTISKIK